MSKFIIKIAQTHSFISDSPKVFQYEVDSISSIGVFPNCFTQIGFRTHAIYAMNIGIFPQGLTIPLFIKSNDYKKLQEVLNELNTIILDDVMQVDMTIKCKDGLPTDNMQVIIIKKVYK